MGGRGYEGSLRQHATACRVIFLGGPSLLVEAGYPRALRGLFDWGAPMGVKGFLSQIGCDRRKGWCRIGIRLLISATTMIAAVGRHLKSNFSLVYIYIYSSKVISQCVVINCRRLNRFSYTNNAIGSPKPGGALYPPQVLGMRKEYN